MKNLFRALLLLASASMAFAQGVMIAPQVALKTVNGVTAPIPNATITVCGPNASGIPCSPVLTNAIYKDTGLTQPQGNPFFADNNGNYGNFAVVPGTYTVTVSASGFSGYSYQFTTPGSVAVVPVNSGGAAAITNAIASLNGNGGIIDARAMSGAQSVSSTVTIPANTVVLLGPSVQFNCTVQSLPCWKLSGQGAKLLGALVGASVGNSPSSPSPGWPAAQSGTVLRMGAGITAITDMIAVNPTPTAFAGVGGYEVANLVIDFANASSNTGRYCLAAYAIMRSQIHDIECYNPGVNGFEFETTTNGWSYDVQLARLYVQQANTDSFKWTTANGSGFADFDRWSCDMCYSHAADANNANFFGVTGFHFVSGPNGAETIADFVFTNSWVMGTGSSGSPAGVKFDQTSAGSYAISNILFTGELEQQSGCSCGTAIQVNNSGSNSAVSGLDFGHITYNTGWAALDNFTTAGMQQWAAIINGNSPLTIFHDSWGAITFVTGGMATWASGTGVPASGTCTVLGSLFSRTDAPDANHALYVCTAASTWSPVTIP